MSERRWRVCRSEEKISNMILIRRPWVLFRLLMVLYNNFLSVSNEKNCRQMTKLVLVNYPYLAKYYPVCTKLRKIVIGPGIYAEDSTREKK